ncbi:cation:proton antiporter [Nocardia sp. NPDC058658]|uniref:cation:proton antiporter n=1 Tax=Nocardia sp. NPDC058658 TaxID=3346580 RepID=UPI00365327C0
MDDHAAISLLLLGAVLVYSLAARRLGRANITAPMVFVVVGVVAGNTGLVQVDADVGWLLTVAEVTLALLLFSDASHLQLREVGRDRGPALCLLLIGLPLSIVAGTLLAYWMFPEHGWAAAALIAAMLAPTDAALGAAVVTDTRVPSRVRRLLNVESGLNDGLATPVVTVLIVVVASETGQLGDQNWVIDALRSLSIAVGVAVAVGGAGGAVLRWCRGHGWTSPLSEQVAVFALALLCYFAAVAIDGNGFVAAFLGGIMFGYLANAELRARTEFTETTGLLASYVVWIAFGAALAWPALADATVRTYVIAVGALTLVRIVPVAIAMAGYGWGPPTVLFVGWFGPRGLATVIFALIALEELGNTAVTDHLVDVASVTVLLSIVAHGFSAAPLAARYGRWAATLPDDAPEKVAVTPPSTRRIVLQADSPENHRTSH